MTNRELKDRLDDLIYTCGMNARYHQQTAANRGSWDKGIRITVGILAVAGLVFAVPNLKMGTLDVPLVGLFVAIISLVVAVILNIVPVGDREKLHGELFRMWSELRKDAEMEEYKVCEADPDAQAPEHSFERVRELAGKSLALDADEPEPNKKRLELCQGDENERRWGEGIRTNAQVEAERKRRFECQRQTT